MVIDSSALLAGLLGEPGADRYLQAIDAAPSRKISAGSVLELYLVLEDRLGGLGGDQLDLILLEAEIKVIPLDREQASIARRAFRRFGKGRHPARLNFGDCMSYALWKVTGEPLLFKGDGFTKTDVEPALV